MRVSRLVPFVFVLALTTNASAAPITYAFSGTWVSLAPDMDFWLPDVVLGASFTGTFELEPRESDPTRIDGRLLVDAGPNQMSAGGFVDLIDGGGFDFRSMTQRVTSPTPRGFMDFIRLTANPQGPDTFGTLFFLMAGPDRDGIFRESPGIGVLQSLHAVPEPSLLALMLLGLGSAFVRRRHR